MGNETHHFGEKSLQIGDHEERLAVPTCLTTGFAQPAVALARDEEIVLKAAPRIAANIPTRAENVETVGLTINVPAILIFDSNFVYPVPLDLDPLERAFWMVDFGFNCHSRTKRYTRLIMEVMGHPVGITFISSQLELARGFAGAKASDTLSSTTPENGRSDGLDAVVTGASYFAAISVSLADA